MLSDYPRDGPPLWLTAPHHHLQRRRGHRLERSAELERHIRRRYRQIRRGTEDTRTVAQWRIRCMAHPRQPHWGRLYRGEILPTPREKNTLGRASGRQRVRTVPLVAVVARQPRSATTRRGTTPHRQGRPLQLQRTTHHLGTAHRCFLPVSAALQPPAHHPDDQHH